jgi:hypothetical protein
MTAIPSSVPQQTQAMSTVLENTCKLGYSFETCGEGMSAACFKLVVGRGRCLQLSLIFELAGRPLRSSKFVLRTMKSQENKHLCAAIVTSATHAEHPTLRRSAKRIWSCSCSNDKSRLRGQPPDPLCFRLPLLLKPARHGRL